MLSFGIMKVVEYAIEFQKLSEFEFENVMDSKNEIKRSNMSNVTCITRI